MQTFAKPTNLNGAELRAELNAAGVAIDNAYDSVAVDSNDLLLKIADKDKAKAAAVVAAHHGTTIAQEATVEDKLASVGLSISSLKSALGL